MPFGWRWLTATDLMLVISAGVLQGSAHYLYIEAYRLAQAGLVSPYKYSQLIWALIFGFIFWDYVPNVWIVIGSVLVVGAGFIVCIAIHGATHNDGRTPKKTE